MNLEQILKNQKQKSTEAVEALKRDLKKVRTGRASPGLLSGITVDAYGSKMPLEHMGQISAPEANLLVINVFDVQNVDLVEKAVVNSGLGFNPGSEGNVIRIVVPPLTEERRIEIVRHIHKIGENFKVSVRNQRRDANDELKKLEKSGEVSKDEVKRAMDNVQKVTDKHIALIEDNLKAKESECMAV